MTGTASSTQSPSPTNPTHATALDVADDMTKVLAFQSEKFAQFAEQTARTYAQREVARALAERQAAEDIRANHRNLNRMLTLIMALVIGIVVSYVLSHDFLGSFGHALAPYAFVITILLDSSLAAYSFIRHY